MKITSRHRHAAALMATGMSHAKVAEAVDVTTGCYSRRWMKDPDFLAVVATEDEKFLALASQKVQQRFRDVQDKAIGHVEKVLQSKTASDKDKLSAARIVLSAAAIHRMAGTDAAQKVEVEASGVNIYNELAVPQEEEAASGEDGDAPPAVLALMPPPAEPA